MSNLFLDERKKQKDKGVIDFDRLTSALEEDTLNNGSLSDGEFLEVLSLLERLSDIPESQLFDFLSVFWSLPDFLSPAERKRFVSVLFGRNWQDFSQKGTLIIVDCLYKIATQKEFQKLSELALKNEHIAYALKVVGSRP